MIMELRVKSEQLKGDNGLHPFLNHSPTEGKLAEK